MQDRRLEWLESIQAYRIVADRPTQGGLMIIQTREEQCRCCAECSVSKYSFSLN
jgi:hypothetical protein